MSRRPVLAVPVKRLVKDWMVWIGAPFHGKPHIVGIATAIHSFVLASVISSRLFFLM